MKHFFLFCSAFFCLCLSACFTITEEITLQANGSGSVKTSVDMSEMMNMLGMFLPDTLKKDLDISKILSGDTQSFKKMEGISNMKVNSEKPYHYVVSFDFANADALNRALSSTSDSGAGKMLEAMKSQYRIKKRSLQRQTSIDQKLLPAELKGTQFEEAESMMQFINSPTYQVIYHLPKKTKKVTINDKGGTLSKDENTVSIQYNLLDFVKNNGNIMDHCIKF